MKKPTRPGIEDGTDDMNPPTEEWAGYDDGDFEDEEEFANQDFGGGSSNAPESATPETVADRRPALPFVQVYGGMRLPNAGSTSIALNPHFARSALFGSFPVSLGSDRHIVPADQEEKLACGYDGWMTFTGPRWGQDHASVLFQLLLAMRGMRLEEPLLVHPREFAHRALEWSYSFHSQRKLLQALIDLSEGAITRPWLDRFSLATEVRILRAPEHVGRKIRIYFDSRYEDTLHGHLTYISLTARSVLRVGIETWLYQFVRASSCDREMSISRLHALFASRKSLAEFGRDLRAALKKLRECGLVEGFSTRKGAVSITKKVGKRS